MARVRKEAGRNLDPETAEVSWRHAQTADRQYFARAVGTSDVWVSFEHLPSATVERLQQKIEAGNFAKGKGNGNYRDGTFTGEAIQERQWLRSVVRAYGKLGPSWAKFRN